MIAAVARAEIARVLRRLAERLRVIADLESALAATDLDDRTCELRVAKADALRALVTEIEEVIADHEPGYRS